MKQFLVTLKVPKSELHNYLELDNLLAITYNDNSVQLNTEKRDKITAICTSVCGITYTKLKSKTRKQEVVFCRHMLRYYLRKYTNLSLEQIAKHTKSLSHRTVMCSIEKTKDLSNPLYGNKNFIPNFNKAGEKVSQYYKIKQNERSEN